MQDLVVHSWYNNDNAAEGLRPATASNHNHREVTRTAMTATSLQFSLFNSKQCTRCLCSKPLTEFYRCSGRLTTRCKPCMADIQREYRKKRPKGYWKNKDKRYALKKRYGLSLEEYERRMNAQKGLCAICGLDPREMGEDERHKILHVDHCHSTGRVRGLLCNGCNRAIGLINENVETARNLVTYLEELASDR